MAETQTLEQAAEAVAQAAAAAPAAAAGAAAPGEANEANETAGNGDADEESGGAGESGEEGAEATATKPGGLKAFTAKVAGIVQDRGALRERIRDLEAENARLQAEVERLTPLAEEHAELQREVDSLEQQQQTVEQGVRAELETVGVPEETAPEATDEVEAASPAELLTAMENEEDPARRRELWKQYQAAQKAG